MEEEKKTEWTDEEAMRELIEYNEEVMQEAMNIWNYDWANEAMKYLELHFVIIDDDLIERVKNANF